MEKNLLELRAEVEHKLQRYRAEAAAYRPAPLGLRRRTALALIRLAAWADLEALKAWTPAPGRP